MAKISDNDMLDIMKSPDRIRNIGIAAHIDHGKTTLTDNLVAGAGIISDELAGKQLFTDFDAQEQERGITIFSANVSMAHKYENDSYIINLIDTPGHVDFGGDVTRAMRAVDGAVVVACAVEGVMPQTETVIRQALAERVKPVLFINKVDRLIKELQLTPEQMQQKFLEIIDSVNQMIKKYAESKFAEQWYVKVEDGSVAFGSAVKNWAISVPYMKEKNISFKDIINASTSDNEDELAKKAPLHDIVLNMVIQHLPSPIESQKYRIEKLWSGENESDHKDMELLNKDGKLAAVVTKVTPDPHAGFVATARIFSGTLKKGDTVKLVGQNKNQRIQQLAIYRGPQRVQVDEISVGNIVGIVGLTEAFSGETITDIENPITPFESIQHMFEPVVTKSIEPEDPKDLPKMVDFLRQLTREDPTLQVKINEETGENIISGLGELHIEAKVERPLIERKIKAKTSLPIVIYRETIKGESREYEVKSGNKHNTFVFLVEPLEKGVVDKIYSGEIEEKTIKKYLKQTIPTLVEAGMSRDDAKNIEDMYNKNVLIDSSKGVQYLNEIMKLVIEGFRKVMNNGPQASEPCTGLKVRLMDASLHTDNIHRGPAQVIPTVVDGVKQCVREANPGLMEPVQKIRVDVPEEQLGNAMNLVQNRRGVVQDTKMEQGTAAITVDIPVAETFGMEAALKSSTEGKGFYSLVEISYQKVPEDLKHGIITQIRQRKGLGENQ